MNVLYPQLWVTATSIFVVLLFWIVVRRTTAGVAMRAVVDNPDLVAMQARSPAAIRGSAAIYGASLAALSGVLILPFVGLDPIGLTLLVVQAFGAAAIGRFSNLPLTFIGAIAIGVVSNLCVKLVLGHAALAGLPNSVPLIVLFVVLLVTPRRQLERASGPEARQATPWNARPEARVLLGIVVVVLLALVPLLVDASKLPFFTIGPAAAWNKRRPTCAG